MKRLEVLDFRKHYIDNLEAWVEVPVWNQEELIRMVDEINWEEFPITEYKKMLVENLPGLPVILKDKLRNPAVQNELYDVLLHENWGLTPSEKKAPEHPYYSEVEQDNVQLWFSSNGKKGRTPDIF